MEKTVSTTDRNAVFHKESTESFAYEAWPATHNFIFGVHVTPGNIHDSVFDPLYDDIWPLSEQNCYADSLQNTLDLQKSLSGG
ncbi:MAG: hypothetical protein ACLSDM_03645 [Butyricicoccus sp.]